MTTPPTSDAAITAALEQNWNEALRINTEILKIDTNNIEALNRLSFAYIKLGNTTLAKRFLNKVLTLDRYNQIALKNMIKLTSVRKKVTNHMTQPVSPLAFLEEPGKTKIVQCVNAAPAKVLETLVAGQEVYMKPKRHGVEIRDGQDTFLGALPDDLSFKLIKFITGGNQYQVIVKGVGKNSLMVLIRETHRGKRFATQPSFTSSLPYIPASRIYDADKPEVTATGEDGEEESPEEETKEE